MRLKRAMRRVSTVIFDRFILPARRSKSERSRTRCGPRASRFEGGGWSDASDDTDYGSSDDGAPPVKPRAMPCIGCGGAIVCACGADSFHRRRRARDAERTGGASGRRRAGKGAFHGGTSTLSVGTIEHLLRERRAAGPEERGDLPRSLGRSERDRARSERRALGEESPRRGGHPSGDAPQGSEHGPLMGGAPFEGP